MSSKSSVKASATDIVKINLDKYPNIGSYLNILVQNTKVQVQQKSKQFEYPEKIFIVHYSMSNGIFMDYFIRKVVSNIYRKQLKEYHTEVILNNVEAYFSDYEKEKRLPQIIERHYEVFRDANSRAMDIIRSIKITALSTILFYRDPLPKTEVVTDINNLLEVKNYFEQLPYTGVEIKLSIDCEYFEGNADMIFDQKVIFEVTTSAHRSLSRYDEDFKMRNFYKLIMYGFGYYKRTGIILKRYTIYNPLLGLEYSIELDHINMTDFEKSIQKDINIHII